MQYISGNETNLVLVFYFYFIYNWISHLHVLFKQSYLASIVRYQTTCKVRPSRNVGRCAALASVRCPAFKTSLCPVITLALEWRSIISEVFILPLSVIHCLVLTRNAFQFLLPCIHSHGRLFSPFYRLNSSVVSPNLVSFSSHLWGLLVMSCEVWCPILFHSLFRFPLLFLQFKKSYTSPFLMCKIT